MLPLRPPDRQTLVRISEKLKWAGVYQQCLNLSFYDKWDSCIPHKLLISRETRQSYRNVPRILYLLIPDTPCLTHLLPQCWTWTWGPKASLAKSSTRPVLRAEWFGKGFFPLAPFLYPLSRNKRKIYIIRLLWRLCIVQIKSLRAVMST